jgi:hypothetical protein
MTKCGILMDREVYGTHLKPQPVVATAHNDVGMCVPAGQHNVVPESKRCEHINADIWIGSLRFIKKPGKSAKNSAALHATIALFLLPHKPIWGALSWDLHCPQEPAST